MAQVNAPNVKEKDDALTTLMKGLTIASQVYGIRADSAQLEKYEREKKKEDRVAQGIYNKGERVALADKYNISDKQTDPNAVAITAQETNSPLYLSLKKDNSPLIEKISSIKNGKQGTLVVDVKSGKELGFYPSSKTEFKTREVETVNAQGQPVKMIVEDRPGQEFALNPEKNRPAKEQFDAALFGKRMETADQVLNNLAEQGFNRANTIQGINSYILPNALKSNELKQQEQAERNFVNAALRRESGANINKDEFENASLQYFPRAGDTPEVLAQKAQNRQQVIEGMRAAAGNAWDKVATPQIANQKKASSGEAYAAPRAPSALDLLQQKAKAGDKKAQQYLNSLNGGK